MSPPAVSCLALVASTWLLSAAPVAGARRSVSGDVAAAGDAEEAHPFQRLKALAGTAGTLLGQGLSAGAIPPPPPGFPPPFARPATERNLAAYARISGGAQDLSDVPPPPPPGVPHKLADPTVSRSLEVGARIAGGAEGQPADAPNAPATTEDEEQSLTGEQEAQSAHHQPIRPHMQDASVPGSQEQREWAAALREPQQQALGPAQEAWAPEQQAWDPAQQVSTQQAWAPEQQAWAPEQQAWAPEQQAWAPEQQAWDSAQQAWAPPYPGWVPPPPQAVYQQHMDAIVNRLERTGYWAGSVGQEYGDPPIYWSFAFRRYAPDQPMICDLKATRESGWIETKGLAPLVPQFFDGAFIGMGGECLGPPSPEGAQFSDQAQQSQGTYYFVFKVVEGHLLVEVSYVQEGYLMYRFPMWLSHHSGAQT